MILNKVTKITIWGIFGAVFAVSLYVNYLYFSEYLQGKTAKNEAEKGITEENIYMDENVFQNILFGVVENIDDKKISITIVEGDGLEKKEMTISLNENTKFTKTYTDPEKIEAVNSEVDKSEIIINQPVTIVLTEESDSNNMIAARVDYVFNNNLNGLITEVLNNSIKIEKTSVEEKNVGNLEVMLSNNAEYYSIEMRYDEKEQKVVKGTIQKIDKADIKKDSTVIIFFDNDILKYENQSSNRVVVTVWE